MKVTAPAAVDDIRGEMQGGRGLPESQEELRRRLRKCLDRVTGQEQAVQTGGPL